MHRTMAAGILLGWAITLVAGPGFAQTAELPASWTGPWQYAAPPEGWAFSGLGVDILPDYDGINDGAAKLDSAGDWISIHFDEAPALVSYWIKGLTFISGGVFRVEQSMDGLAWTDLHTYTNLPTTATFTRHVPALASRHIRFRYVERITGNVGVDAITIARYTPPAVASLVRTGGVVRATVGDTGALRTYVLEYTRALDAAPWVEWTQADSKPGTDGPLVLSDPEPTNTMRFYRVRDRPPMP